jgi:small conductance mechanosensitive channel
VIDLGDVVERALELIVRIALVLAVIAAFAAVGRATTPLVRRYLDRRRRPSRTRVFSGLYRVAMLVVGSLFALTLAFPSVRVADVLAIFGIVSVAAGFAFRDTFENLLAGVLLLLRDPFQSGDEVRIADREGTVEGVTVRETLVRGHDGRQFFIPNARVMTDVIEVETDGASLRQSVSIRLDARGEAAIARRVVEGALRAVDGVNDEPAPEAVITDVVDGDIELDCRFWSSSRRSVATRTRDAAIESIMCALNRSGVALAADEVRVRLSPSPTNGTSISTGG